MQTEMFAIYTENLAMDIGATIVGMIRKKEIQEEGMANLPI
jgi:hypothetical protein